MTWALGSLPARRTRRCEYAPEGTDEVAKRPMQIVAPRMLDVIALTMSPSPRARRWRELASKLPAASPGGGAASASV